MRAPCPACLILDLITLTTLDTNYKQLTFRLSITTQSAAVLLRSEITVQISVQCQRHEERSAMKQLTVAGMRQESRRQAVAGKTCLHSYFQSKFSLLKPGPVHVQRQVSDPTKRTQDVPYLCLYLRLNAVHRSPQ
jgi:hypothetical protein